MKPIVIPPEVEELAGIAVDSALAVHTELGPGLLESAYAACFTHERLPLGLLMNFNELLIKHGFQRVLNLHLS
jgi:hypothetical protein